MVRECGKVFVVRGCDKVSAVRWCGKGFAERGTVGMRSTVGEFKVRVWWGWVK